MPYKCIMINHDDTISCETHEKLPDWKKIQAHVMGPFQIIPYFSSLEYEGEKLTRGAAYANEEGWIRHLPYNKTATHAWMKACPTGDPRRMRLFGPVLFVVKEKKHVQAS